MTGTKGQLLQKAKWLTVSFSAGVILLSVQFLREGYFFFQYAAVLLAVCGLIIISLIINRIIRQKKILTGPR